MNSAEKQNLGVMECISFAANTSIPCKETLKRPASPSAVYASPPKKQKQEAPYKEWFTQVKVKYGVFKAPGYSMPSRIERHLQMEGVPVLKRSDVNLTCTRLGEGSYGTCFKSVDPRTKEVVVIKKFTGGGDDALQSLLDEAITLSQVQVEGVQRLVGVCLKPQVLVTRFAGVTADNYYINNGTSFADVVSVCLQVSRALQRINQHGYCHNDIKRDNICISNDEGIPVATVIDLGLSTPVGSMDTFGGCNDPELCPHVAPEVLMNTSPCGEPSDVFGLAYLIIKLGLTKAKSQCRSMASLLTLVCKARCTDPCGRPSLAALIKVLEKLHMEAATT